MFIDSDLSTQLKTRLTRDMNDRGHSRSKALDTFFGSNLKEFAEHGAYTKEWADVALFCHKDYSLSVKSLSPRLYTLLK